MRIVSLVPSATEIVCELGLIDQLVGISQDCDWPPQISGRPVLSGAIIGGHGPSVELNPATQLHHGRSVYHLDEGQLQALKPDLILTQELCQACAPAYSDVLRAARIVDEGARIVSLEPTTLCEILDNINLVGALTGQIVRAQQLLAELEARIERVRSRADCVEYRPRVLCLEWLEPLFVAGHWVTEMVEMAGGEPWGVAGEPSYEVLWEEVERFNPEVIVLMPCVVDPQRTAQALDLLSDHEGWQELTAVKRDQVYLAHGSVYFSRPGPRAVTGLEILAKALHPKLFYDFTLPQGAMYKMGPWL